MKEDSDQKERCNKKAEGKFGFLRTVSQIQRAKKPKNALYINRIYFARQSWEQRKTIDFCRLLCYIKTVGLKPMVLNDGGTLWQSV